MAVTSPAARACAVQDEFPSALVLVDAQTAALALLQDRPAVPWVCPVAAGVWVDLAAVHLDVHATHREAARDSLSAGDLDFQQAVPARLAELARRDAQAWPPVKPLLAASRRVVSPPEPRQVVEFVQFRAALPEPQSEWVLEPLAALRASHQQAHPQAWVLVL